MKQTVPEAAGRPLRRDASRNRERVLAAARELFAERGLEVTMDQIARRAGVGVGTAYRRFGTRGELIEALFEDRIQEYGALAEEALAVEDPWEALSGFFERAVAMRAADRGLHELLTSHADALERLARSRARILPLVEELVRRAQAAGELRADLEVTDMPVLSLMLGEAVEFSADADPSLWQRYVVIVLDGLRARRDAPSPLGRGPLAVEQLDAAMSTWRPRRRARPGPPGPA